MNHLFCLQVLWPRSINLGDMLVLALAFLAVVTLKFASRLKAEGERENQTHWLARRVKSKKR